MGTSGSLRHLRSRIGPISYYRLYFLKPGTSHIGRFADFEAVDDLAAQALAEQHEGEASMELWCGTRRVARFDRSGGQTSLRPAWG